VPNHCARDVATCFKAGHVFLVALATLCFMRQPLPNTMTSIASSSDDEFVGLVQEAVALPDAPQPWLRAAVDLWPAQAPLAAAASAWRLVQAVLGFDSWAQPALVAGLRSGASDTRHLLFNAQGRDVDLRIARVGGAFVLSGQILGPDETGIVELVSYGAGASDKLPAALVTSLDELGEFRIDGVASGTYQLGLRVGGDHIVLPTIEVGERHR
jgi:hypothetical protein